MGAKNISTEPGGPLSDLDRSKIPQLEKLFIDGILRASKIAEKEDVKILVSGDTWSVASQVAVHNLAPSSARILF